MEIEDKDRKNYFKWEDGWNRLIEIVKGDACNIRGKLHYDGTLSSYPAHGEIEFLIHLLKDIYEKGEFVDTIAKQDYPILKEHGLPRNFNLAELIEYFGNDGAMRDFNGWYFDEIKDVKIEGSRVHLDVLVREIGEKLA